MFIRGIRLSLAALVAVGALAGAAQADNRRLPPPPDYYDPDFDDGGAYEGPPVIRHIPGLRILFGDYAMTDEELDALHERMRRQFDERYYEPEPVPPKAKRVTPPKKPETAAKPASGTKPAAGAAAKGQTQKAAAAKQSPKAGLSCEKAGSVISGYGFSSVQAASCAGKTYAFNATRDGKTFAIKLDPASGELTEVKKLP